MSNKARDHVGRKVTEFEAGQPVFYWLTTCSCCERETRTKAHRPDEHPRMIERALQRAGWRVGQRLVCPDCLAAKRGAAALTNLTPSQETPAMSAATATKPILSAAVAIDPVAAVTPPRQPTPEERRAVREALFDAYDEDRGRYTGVGSDEGLAAALDVPRIWVSDLRESMGLGPDTCEAADAYEKEIAKLNQDLAALSTEFVERFSVMENRVRKLEIDRSYAGKKAA